MSPFPTESSSQTSPAEAIRLFLDNLEGYYAAQYNAVQRGMITGWLASQEPERIDGIYRELVRVKLYQNRLPLIAHFEEASQALEEKEAAARPDPMRERAKLALAYREEPRASDEEIKTTLAEILENLSRAKRFTNQGNGSTLAQELTPRRRNGEADARVFLELGRSGKPQHHGEGGVLPL